MGEIKSALELALEKTNNVKSDRTLIIKNEADEAGRKAAFEFLEEGSTKLSALEAKIKAADKENRQWVKEGMFKVFISNLKLPEDKSSFEKIGRLKEGFSAIAEKKKEVLFLFDQIETLFNNYLQNKTSAVEKLKNSYARKLKEKEIALSQQLGKEVHLKPENDPEFLEYLQKTIGQLDEQFQEVLIKVKEELKKRI
ncbi:MAG: hypothetical protein RBT69_01710 [Spirochaetia bacterium]|jgi:hypothetical protein|nr:hypothetical protein [Spirochaetia bacterium]